jgi:hypothetical protein
MSGLNQRFAKPSTDESWSVGSNPTLSTNFRAYSLMVKRRTHNSRSLGSIPSGPTNIMEVVC